ncbi:MAG TPA: DUF481 domain-containing protein [Verrucomicrobiae bacterium]|nr:DUF481 domain-containing protein [Verrucomicrobiae bacterium]
MISLRRRVNLICRALALLVVLFLAGTIRAQNVVLHLRNGDRIAGTILSENTNTVTLSTVWIKELAVPVSQIERREILPPPPLAAATNIVIATNAVVTAGTTNLAAVKPSTVALTTNAPPAPWFKRWKGEAAVGMDMERGATDHELYYGRIKATYSQPYVSDPKEFFRNILTYDAAYGKTAGVLSDNKMGGSSKTDFDLNPRCYIYNLGAASYDVIRKINVHYEDGPGMGYHLFKGTNFAANAELGANYQVEERSDNTRTESFYYRFGEDLTWKLNKQMTFTEKFEIFPRVDYIEQFRSRFECNLNYALILNFALNFTVVDLYDTRPAAGVPNNDFQFRTMLSFKF